MPTDKLCPNDFRDIEKALMVQHIFNILPVNIAWLLNSNFLSLVVFILNFLQLQPHQADASLVKSFNCHYIPKWFPELA